MVRNWCNLHLSGSIIKGHMQITLIKLYTQRKNNELAVTGDMIFRR